MTLVVSFLLILALPAIAIALAELMFDDPTEQTSSIF